MTDSEGLPTPPADLTAGYDALHTSAGVVLLPRDVVRASGPEAATYLQGQCSQDVDALEVGGSAESLLLTPQGKVEVYLRMTRVADDEFVLDADGGFGPVMVARLERFRLRTKVEFETLDWACAAVRGPDAARSVTNAPELVLPTSFAGLQGVDLLGPLPAGGVGAWVADSATHCPFEAWEAARIEAGIPVNGRELVDGTIAAEVGLVDRTVSFTKGCFTGQELVARLEARGSKVAHHLRGVVLTGPADHGGVGPDAVANLVGCPVSTADGRHQVGQLSSVAWSPAHRRPVALAALHRRVEPPEAVVVEWTAPDGEVGHLAGEARVLPLPAAP
jgi:folate-binding protein YgfZ